MFFQWANPGLFFCLFPSFLHDTIQNLIDKSIDGVLGTRTQGSNMEGADNSTELWRLPDLLHMFLTHTVLINVI